MPATDRIRDILRDMEIAWEHPERVVYANGLPIRTRIRRGVWRTGEAVRTAMSPPFGSADGLMGWWLARCYTGLTRGYLEIMESDEDE